MAFLTAKNEVTLKFVDVRDERRNRTIELASAYIMVEDDAVLMDTVSKSAVLSFRNTNKQVDLARTPTADSEVKDTGRLYFQLADDTIAHFDIIDPADSLFLDTTGEGANIMRSVPQMLLVGGAAGIACDAIIAKILLGDILISDGEEPVKYLYGKRV